MNTNSVSRKAVTVIIQQVRSIARVVVQVSEHSPIGERYKHLGLFQITCKNTKYIVGEFYLGVILETAVLAEFHHMPPTSQQRLVSQGGYCYCFGHCLILF